jgi:superfamily II DNA or RNA helicase
MVELRVYQAEAIASLRAARAQGFKRMLLVAPCGAGKTTIAAELVRGAVARGTSVLFVAHRKELIDQAGARFDRFGIEHGIIKSGRTPTPAATVQVASIQTLVNRTMPPAGLIIIDESHRAAAGSYRKVLDHYPGASVIGLTATPIRSDGRGLADTFEHLVEAAKIENLVEAGFLMQPRVYAPAVPELSGVNTTAGDFNAGELAEAMDRPRLIGDIVAHWERLAAGLPTVAFASSVQHSIHVRDAFRAAGVACAHLDGTTSDDEREAILAGLAAGAITVVSNVGVLCEGYDLPALSAVILARPTKSLALYLQQVGRALRTSPGKDRPIIIDHAGCTLMHGMATAPREWSLDPGRARPAGAAVKTCPDCYAVVASKVNTCPECGHAWKVEPQKREIAHDHTGRLVELAADFRMPLPPLPDHDRWLDPYRTPGREPTTAEKRALYDHLAGMCIERGYRPGWIAHKFQLTFGTWPGPATKNASPHAAAIAAKAQAARNAEATA